MTKLQWVCLIVLCAMIAVLNDAILGDFDGFQVVYLGALSGAAALSFVRTFS